MQSRLDCKHKQGWFTNAIKAGLQTQTRQVCKHKQSWFASTNMAGLCLEEGRGAGFLLYLMADKV
jgi:hypothetical protein